jgi:hypothetical protein
MLPGETIVWSRKAGSVFWIMFCGIGLPMVGVMAAAFIFPAFERIGETVECPYCRYDNTAMSPQCKNCDAVL